MSSQDGSNRSQQNRRSPGQRPADASRRQNQTWDIDPAEIDRYLSGRPTRAEDVNRRAPSRRAAGETAKQLSRLQNAVRPPAEPRQADTTATYRSQPVRQQRQSPDPADDAYGYGYEIDDPVDMMPYDQDELSGYDDTYDDEEWEAPAPAPRQTPRRQPSTRSRTSRAPRRYDVDPVDVYPVDDDDEELYNDDPYLGYEDEQLDRRPPRAPRAARQRPGVSRSNLPRFTVPASISDSPLLTDRMSVIMAGIALASVALMAFIVSDRITLLGDTIPTHVSASGDAEQLRTREAVWNIPLLAGMVMLMNVAASWFVSRIDQFASRFLLASGLLVHFIAWVALFKYLWE